MVSNNLDPCPTFWELIHHEGNSAAVVLALRSTVHMINNYVNEWIRLVGAISMTVLQVGRSKLCLGVQKRMVAGADRSAVSLFGRIILRCRHVLLTAGGCEVGGPKVKASVHWDASARRARSLMRIEKATHLHSPA